MTSDSQSGTSQSGESQGGVSAAERAEIEALRGEAHQTRRATVLALEEIL